MATATAAPAALSGASCFSHTQGRTSAPEVTTPTRTALSEKEVHVVVHGNGGECDAGTRGAQVTPATARRELRADAYGTVSSVLRCRFVLLQCVFNVVSSIVCSLFMFWLLFAFLSEGPYPWTSPNLVGVVIGSAALVSPALVMSLAPMGIPEALNSGASAVRCASM